MNVTQPIELKITWNPGEAPQISGPIADKVLCYGLIGILQEVIKDFKPEDVPRISTPNHFMRAETGKILGRTPPLG